MCRQHHPTNISGSPDSKASEAPKNKKWMQTIAFCGIVYTESKSEGVIIRGKRKKGYGNWLRQKIDGANGSSRAGWPGGQSAL